MTVYERVQMMNPEELAHFIFLCQQQAIDEFANFVFPSEEKVKELLETEM